MIEVCAEGKNPAQPVIQTVDVESAGVGFSLWAISHTEGSCLLIVDFRLFTQKLSCVLVQIVVERC